MNFQFFEMISSIFSSNLWWKSARRESSVSRDFLFAFWRKFRLPHSSVVWRQCSGPWSARTVPAAWLWWAAWTKTSISSFPQKSSASSKCTWSCEQMSWSKRCRSPSILKDFKNSRRCSDQQQTSHLCRKRWRPTSESPSTRDGKRAETTLDYSSFAWWRRSSRQTQTSVAGEKAKRRSKSRRESLRLGMKSSRTATETGSRSPSDRFSRRRRNKRGFERHCRLESCWWFRTAVDLSLPLALRADTTSRAQWAR